MSAQYPPQQPYGQQYPQTPPPRPTDGNGFGIAALIIGIVALVGAFIPAVNVGAAILAFVGLVLGIIGLVQKNRAKGTSITGTILSGIALVLSIIMILVYTALLFAGLNKAGEELGKFELDVTYEVTGTATNATIIYTTFEDGERHTEQATGQTLPFSEDLDVTIGEALGAVTSFSVTATNGPEDSGEITCSITLDNDTVVTETASGPGASVTCSSEDFDSSFAPTSPAEYSPAE